MAKTDALFTKNLDALRRGKTPAGQFRSDLPFECVATVFLLVTWRHERCGRLPNSGFAQDVAKHRDLSEFVERTATGETHLHFADSAFHVGFPQRAQNIQ